MSTRSRRILRFASIAAATALIVTGCSRIDGGGGAAPDDGSGDIRERTIVFAHITADTFPYQAGAMKFKELLEESTDGAMKVTVYPGGQLGNERDINESILEGSVHIGVGAGALATQAKIMNLLELPFMIGGQEHMQRIIDSPVAEKLADRIEEQGGYEVVAWFSTGDSAIQTVDRAISTPADMQGLKLRAIENPALADALSALGANPTPMPYGEVYTGVQTGVVEGATLDWGSVNSMHLYEIVKYTTSHESAFLAEPRPVIVSRAFWDGLNDAERKVFSTAIQEAAAFERETFLDVQTKAIAAIEAAGLTFTELDQDAFQAVLEPVWQKWAKDLDAQEILDGILELR